MPHRGRTSRRWIVWAVVGAAAHAALIAAYWPVVPRPFLSSLLPPSTAPDPTDVPALAPVRIWATIGIYDGSCFTHFNQPCVRLTSDSSGGDELRGWRPAFVAETTDVVVLVASPANRPSPNLWALPVPPAKNYEGPGWTECRCETDEVPADARADTAWCGRWTWTKPVLGTGSLSVFDDPPTTNATLTLRADGTASLDVAPDASRRWGVVDGVLYLARFEERNDRFAVAVGVRDGDDAIRFAADGEARRVR